VIILVYYFIFFFFPTAPEGEYTHWKQTVFYLDRYIAIKRGERLQGTFSLSPGKENIVSPIKSSVTNPVAQGLVQSVSDVTGSSEYLVLSYFH
jgi:hypothetical protein